MSCPKFTQLFVSARKMKAQALLHGKRSNISQWHFGCFHIHSYRQQQIYCRVSNRICLIPYIWFLMRILDFGKCNPFGTAKAGERFAKELRKGGSWELLFSTTFIHIYIYIHSIYRYVSMTKCDITKRAMIVSSFLVSMLNCHGRSYSSFQYQILHTLAIPNRITSNIRPLD